MDFYPLKLQFIPKSALWGGDRLKTEFGKETDMSPLAETWELTAREKERNLVENGAFGGMTLNEVLETWGKKAISDKWQEERFPLLVKLIDAQDKLSVQVHPNDEYAAAHEKDLGKTEMWCILSAEPGAKIIYGTKPGVTSGMLADALKEGRYFDVLAERPVQAGEVYFIPAGLVHAIGAGIVVAEIQQNSDLTYRVYDYDRRQKDGSLRPLHLEQALGAARVISEEEIQRIRFSGREKGDGVLADCPYFRVRRVQVSGREVIESTPESFHHILCLEGGGSLRYAGGMLPVLRGDSIFIPAGMGEFSLYGDMKVLDTTL